jgi:hypothetical protein
MCSDCVAEERQKTRWIRPSRKKRLKQRRSFEASTDLEKQRQSPSFGTNQAKWFDMV